MEDVLTVDEVARYLRVHPMTVQRWCRTGDLPAAKIGRAYRIKCGNLERWRVEHQAGTAPLHEQNHTSESEEPR
ncbi:MAG: helix-turn-helix domain-containing protein [Chloroflexota bacterium]|nr:helix-turn-helix domain-containing protein [Chloroflexota bacterium]